MTFEGAFIERENWNSQNRENSARGAWAWGTATTNGWGELLFPKPIRFGLTFVTPPFVSYSWVMHDDDDLVDNRFPRCSGGVARWMQDKRDFYTGAYVMVTVATADPLLGALSLDKAETTYLTDPGYGIDHHFTFFGLAIKDINAQRFED